VGGFGYFLLKEKLSVTAWTGCFIAICGAVWLSLGAEAGEHAPNPLLGNTLQISGMVGLASALVLGGVIISQVEIKLPFRLARVRT